MWLFTPFGFFSVVQHRLDENMLLVRARARVDLMNLLARADVRTPIQHTPERDYPYRVTLSREVVAEFLIDFVTTGIDYENFKAEVAKTQGFDRTTTYHHVWDDVRAIEDPEARRPRGARARAASASPGLRSPRSRRAL
jgi:hypothetical protein